MKTLDRVKNLQQQRKNSRSDIIKKESEELKKIEQSSIRSIKNVETTAKKNIGTLLKQQKKQKNYWLISTIVLLMLCLSLISALMTYQHTSTRYETRFHHCAEYKVTNDKQVFCKLQKNQNEKKG